MPFTGALIKGAHIGHIIGKSGFDVDIGRSHGDLKRTGGRELLYVM